jgi:hypothetical protein
MRDLELASEYRMLRRQAVGYTDMSPAQQRAYDRRLGAWLLATGMATPGASLGQDVRVWREYWHHDQTTARRRW